ncbi:SUZ domain-containing protein [Caenorhabditis elegans]|uniref:SUZ domain-containing protein n=1 Tax=Caenorhabditis elegans TaxID=6239 RepID=B2D6L4_CAEEL|nr:SUZ domain-containing protein [Caenorhabditis elegans]CAQ35018.1 SUZ domain-containing protein [Caenorhabditis elegans]|eukprot:NP_001122590.1 Suppressor of zyg-1 protein 20 [Caenorhabditis elegans]
MSKENVSLVVADSWDDADADPVKELMDKVEKVKLLQRKEEKKEAFFEKVKAEESSGVVSKLQTEEGLGPSAEEPKRVFLRRPKDGFAASENVIEASPPTSADTEEQPVTNVRSRSHHKLNQKEKQPAPTYEERQAAYQAARNRILGTEYKPDNQEIKEIKFIDRSKSPETLKMTQQNMVEHYGEELSRELMEQPAEIVPPERQYTPDFTLQQPPPSVSESGGVYNGPPGFQQKQPNFQPTLQQQSLHQQQYLDNQYMMQMNVQIPIQYHNQTQHQFVPHEASAISTTSQNSNGDGQNDQAIYYYQAPTQQPMNYIPYNLPNMAYPPPNFQPQGQLHHQMNAGQLHQIQQQQQQCQQIQHQPPQQHQQVINGQVMNQQNQRNQVNSYPQQNGAGRGQNRQPMMYQMPCNSGPTAKPPPLMNQMQNRCMTNNGQNYQNRNMQQQGQQRSYSSQPQNGQFYQNGNSNQNNPNNGRKQQHQPQQQQNKSGKFGQNRNDMQKNNYQPNLQQPPMSQNPIPFGCPPRNVNAIREQHANNGSPNTGAGILGPHPMMSASQWPALQQNRPQ